jgi:hypothetical protein
MVRISFLFCLAAPDILAAASHETENVNKLDAFSKRIHTTPQG